MAIWNDPQPGSGFGASAGRSGPGVQGGYADAALDAGLRRYMLSIYNYMASGVLLSGIVALLFVRTGMAYAVFASPLRLVLAFAPLIFVMFMSFGINRMAPSTLQLLFWGFCTVMGLSLSSILLVYTGPSIAATFFATAGAAMPAIKPAPTAHPGSTAPAGPRRKCGCGSG